jgi:hypothetical protein
MLYVVLTEGVGSKMQLTLDWMIPFTGWMIPLTILRTTSWYDFEPCSGTQVNTSISVTIYCGTTLIPSLTISLC